MAEKTPRKQDHDDYSSDPRWAALIGLIVILVLAIGAIVLVRELGKASKLQDCLMSGRTNCAPIEVPSRQ
jgi:hypothetical protein